MVLEYGGWTALDRDIEGLLYWPWAEGAAANNDGLKCPNDPAELLRDWDDMKFIRDTGDPLTKASMLIELLERGEMDSGLFFPSLGGPIGLMKPVEAVGDWRSGRSKEGLELGRLFKICVSELDEEENIFPWLSTDCTSMGSLLSSPAIWLPGLPISMSSAFSFTFLAQPHCERSSCLIMPKALFSRSAISDDMRRDKSAHSSVSCQGVARQVKGGGRFRWLNVETRCKYTLSDCKSATLQLLRLFCAWLTFCGGKTDKILSDRK